MIRIYCSETSGENANINNNNYEEYFLLYADNELNADEKKKVEEFVSSNTALRQEFELLLITQVGPDNNIVFPNKEILYRRSEKRIVFLPWMRVAVAAAVLLLVGLFVFNNAMEKNSVQQIAHANATTIRNQTQIISLKAKKISKKLNQL